MTIGILLIALGLLWLLSDLALFRLGGLALWKLWPLLLVAAGLELLLGRTRSGRLLTAALLAALLAFALAWLALPGTGKRPYPGETREVPLTRGLERATLRIEAPLARLEIYALAPASTNAVRARLERLPGQRLHMDDERKRNRLAVRLTGQENRGRFRGELPVWSVGLHPSLRYDLRIDLGLGSGDLDLRELSLDGLRVEAGMGRLHVLFPARGGYDARIEGGVGELDLELPAGLPVELRIDDGIGPVEVTGLSGGRGRWQAQGAGEPLRLTVGAGVGRVRVRAGAPQP